MNIDKEICQDQLTEENERGATMLEYGLLAALIAVVCILAITFLGQRACMTYSRVGSSMATSG